MRFIAEDLRTIMAQLGFRSIDEMSGRVDRLNVSQTLGHWKARGLDLSPILHRSEPPPHIQRLCIPRGLMNDTDDPPDNDLIQQALPALEGAPPVKIDLAITNVRRTLGTRLSYEIARRYGDAGLPGDTIVIHAVGSGRAEFFRFRRSGHFTVTGQRRCQRLFRQRAFRRHAWPSVRRMGRPSRPKKISLSETWPCMAPPPVGPTSAAGPANGSVSATAAR
jgi:hypothetical protein